MKMECDVIRDLLPLYTDGACSGKSCELVEEHLRECPDCSELLRKLRKTEIESGLRSEKNLVLRNEARLFKRRSAMAGAIVAGVFMIPILVCLMVNIASGHGLGWFFIVLAAITVAASLSVVPLMVPEDKLFWTFCSFCVSLVVLLGVVCLYTHGTWFWIASSASLFGLSAVFLPFVIKSRPVRNLIGDSNRLLIILGLDAALFINMMDKILSHGRITGSRFLFVNGVIAGIGLVIFEVLRKRGVKK